MNAGDLNRKFGDQGKLEFAPNRGGALVADLRNEAAAAQIALQGAQLLQWAPHGAAPVLWLSPQARFGAGKTVRGGVPVCWPWFGAHASDPAKPAHGFVRTAAWDLIGCMATGDGQRITFRTQTSAATQDLWPHDAQVTLTLEIGARLRMVLTTLNTGIAPFVLTQALHSYFHVGDIARVQVEGLDGVPYIDALDGWSRKPQAGPVAIDREVDRIYLGASSDVMIVDRALARRIRIAKSGSTSWVVWNPWIDKSARLGDMGADGHRNMLCIETTNAADDAVTLAPGQKHELVTIVTVEEM